MAKQLMEEIFSAPSQVLDKTIEGSTKVVDGIIDGKHAREAKRHWNDLGPGLITGASDNDPAGIATYSQAGAQYGFQLMWLAGFTFPLAATVQEMCARIGLVTGRGLAANIRIHFPKWVLYLCTSLLFIANTFNIGANIGAMAKASQLLLPKLDFAALVLAFAGVNLALQIFTSYKEYAKYLKWLALIMLTYVISAFMIKINWPDAIKHMVIPSISFTKDQIIMICAVLGTTISPYLFFWQTSQEVEEQILNGQSTIKQREALVSNKEMKSMRKDVWFGIFLSNLVMVFIILTCAATLFPAGIHTIGTAAEAASALRPLAGDSAYLLFALGIIGTGMLAIPVLAGSTSYALSESLGWKYGLYRKLKEANAFYGVIIFSTLIGVGLNFVGIDPIKALIYSAIVNGLVAPVVLTLIVLISSNKKVMGERVNHPFVTLIGWVVTGIMTLAGVATVISLFL